MRIELSLLARDPLTSFLSVQKYTFHFSFGPLIQNFSDRFNHLRFPVQGSLRKVLFEPPKQVEVCDGQMGVDARGGEQGRTDGWASVLGHVE
jgi:hypothetical protein